MSREELIATPSFSLSEAASQETSRGVWPLQRVRLGFSQAGQGRVHVPRQYLHSCCGAVRTLTDSLNPFQDSFPLRGSQGHTEKCRETGFPELTICVNCPSLPPSRLSSLSPPSLPPIPLPPRCPDLQPRFLSLHGTFGGTW